MDIVIGVVVAILVVIVWIVGWIIARYLGNRPGPVARDMGATVDTDQAEIVDEVGDETDADDAEVAATTTSQEADTKDEAESRPRT